jgi:hypothetical protein
MTEQILLLPVAIAIAAAEVAIVNNFFETIDGHLRRFLSSKKCGDKLSRDFGSSTSSA